MFLDLDWPFNAFVKLDVFNGREFSREGLIVSTKVLASRNNKTRKYASQLLLTFTLSFLELFTDTWEKTRRGWQLLDVVSHFLEVLGHRFFLLGKSEPIASGKIWYVDGFPIIVMNAVLIPCSDVLVEVLLSCPYLSSDALH